MEPKEKFVVRVLRSELIFYGTIVGAIVGFTAQWYGLTMQGIVYHNDAMEQIALLKQALETHLEITKNEPSEIAELQKFVYTLMKST